MAMAQHLMKAWRKGLLLPPLSAQVACRNHARGSPSLLSSNCLETGVPASPLYFDFWKPRLDYGIHQAPHARRACPARISGLRSSSEPRFFSSHEGSEEATNGRTEGEELSEEEEDRDGEDLGVGDGDDALQLVSKVGKALPDFKDSTEEAAYIGYKVIGQIKAGDVGHFTAPKAFAVVQVGSHQFKISPGDCIYTEKLKFADVNDKLSLEKVLLLGSKSETVIGRPLVPKAYVHAAVEEQVLDAKIIIFKKKRRKNYRRTNGHRQELTRLRILEISELGESLPAAA